MTETTDENPKVPSLFHNYISLAGGTIAVASLASIILLFLLELFSETEQPYLGILTYIMLPGVLVFGIFVILLGVLIERHRRRKLTPEQIAAYPILDLNGPRRRRMFFVFVVVSILFLFMSAFGSYRAYEFTESVYFCGQVCHDVMKPEFVAYNATPHARVLCVECHVGGGAEHYVRSKFTGVRQLYGVITGSFNKPIETPVKNMRPARDICEKCHWPEKFFGEQLKVFNHYGYDKDNSLSQTRMLIKTGGGNPNSGQVAGIHWHMNLANEITFISTDEKRQNIPWVQMKSADGKVREFTAKDSTLSPQQIAESPKRQMDCIDCHSRPAHVYLSPSNAVDRSLDAGKLDLSLPFIKAKAVEFLTKQYANTDEALNSIAKIDEYYRTSHADIYPTKKESVAKSVAEVQRIYQTFFFPEMKTDWKTHANNIGHYNFEGCFRCHDGQHFSSDGQKIRNECSVCHTTIDQTFRGKTTVPKDGVFQHPINLGDRGNWKCAACHKADRAFVHPVNLGDISKFECAECHSGQSLKLVY